MHLLAEMGDRAEDGVGIVEEIGHQDDEATPRDRLGQRVKGATGVGAIFRGV